ACEYQDANKDVDQRRRSHPDSPKAPRQYGPLEWLRRPEFYDLMAGYRGEIAKSDEDRLIRSLYKESWSAFYRTAAVEFAVVSGWCRAPIEGPTFECPGRYLATTIGSTSFKAVCGKRYHVSSRPNKAIPRYPRTRSRPLPKIRMRVTGSTGRSREISDLTKSGPLGHTA